MRERERDARATAEARARDQRRTAAVAVRLEKRSAVMSTILAGAMRGELLALLAFLTRATLLRCAIRRAFEMTPPTLVVYSFIRTYVCNKLSDLLHLRSRISISARFIN